MKIKINISDVGWNIIDNEFIIYSIKNNSYYTLNDTAIDIWDFIFSKNDYCLFDDLVKYVCNLYDFNDIDFVRSDMENIINVV